MRPQIYLNTAVLLAELIIFILRTPSILAFLAPISFFVRTALAFIGRRRRLNNESS